MGKSYIENSLKRFLKRKVKITLGLVVTFMITGAVGFAEDTRKQEHNEKIAGIETANKNLAGIGTTKFEDMTKPITIGREKYTVEVKNNILKFKTTDSSGTNSIEIEGKYISSELAEEIKTGLNSGTTDIITDKQVTGNNDKIIIKVGNQGQNITNNEGYNKGIIANKGHYGQEIAVNIAGYNYGIITNKGKWGQFVNNGGTAYNYGIIANDEEQGQTTTNGKLYNYGIIANNGMYGQYVSAKGEAYNYGLIENNGNNPISVSNDGRGYNYGVVKNTTGSVFNGKVNNYGLVILTNEENQKASMGTGENKGIVLDYNYNVIREDTKIFTSEDTIKDFAGESSFDGLSKGYVKNESVNIDNVQDKVLGAVVTETLDKAVFNYSGDDLFLKGTSLVGYFEQNGTLLDVGTGNLTLAGNTNITAVKNDFNLDVTAVQLGEKGSITIMDSAKINGIIKGTNSSNINFTESKGKYNVDGGKVVINIEKPEEDGSKYLQYFDITLDGTTSGVQDSEVNEIQISTINGVKDLTNRLVIGKNLTVNENSDGNSIYTKETDKDVQLEVIVEDMSKIKGNVLLGTGTDTFITNNIESKNYKGNIDLGAGTDTFKVKYGETASYEDEQTGKVTGYSVFDYKVNNAENIVLSGKGHWTIGENAHIGFTDNGTKAGNTAFLKAADGATLNIIMNEGGSNLNNMIKDGGLLEEGNRLVLGTDKDSLIKYQIGGTGLPFKTEDTSYTADYGIEKDANVVAPIFNVTSDGKTTSISLKTAQQAGVGNYAPIYNAYINQVANKNWDVIKYINSLNSDEELTERIIKTDVNAKAYYTAGTVVTKNITDSYLSAVEDFKERAGKGEWLAQGKFINSDTEFDGGSKVKGYDGDINSAVGMVEYGLTENTSYGVAFGGGDTEIDIDGGGKLDGDNYYLGFYTKHRTANGIDLVGNFGIMKSDLDSTLGNEFSFTVDDSNISDKTFEKGTADSTAFALSLKGKKDFYVTDSVKLQPVVGARMTLINQDKAENPAMNFEIKEQDVFIAEGILGANIAKEFALENGKLEFNTGIEYAFAASTENEDAEYRLFNNDDIKIENSKIASSKGTAHVGVDYEHENGVGFNGKYEMMWSDKGDDSRITAGISYRF